MNEKEKTHKKLRESMGHNGIEVLGGLVLGSLLGYVLSLLPW